MARVIHNADIAEMFEKLADLLEIEDANRFRVRAYRNAAREVSSLPREVSDMVANGEDLAELPAIGDDLAAKITEIVETGRLHVLDEASARVPPGLLEIVALPGFGPKRARLLHSQLGVENLKDLAAKIKSGAAGGIPGIGKTILAKALQGIERAENDERRFKLFDAERIAEPLLAYLNKVPGIAHAVGCRQFPPAHGDSGGHRYSGNQPLDSRNGDHRRICTIP
jgi:DNA polymerase (family 10)